MNGRLVLECRHNDVTVGGSVSPSSGYYSAYLWLMFLIQDAQGHSFHAEPWKNLFVIFEHGNIADATTYHTLKEQLVAKACATLATVLAEGDRSAEFGGSKSPLRFAYVCAFDDSNCGEGDDALFRPDRLGRRTPQGAVTFEETTILAMLRRSLQNLPDDHVLRSGRLVLPTEGASGPVNPYSSCHLPEIIEQFYADLVEVA